jgi:IclR family KDG regulon transcriptional repressor
MKPRYYVPSVDTATRALAMLSRYSTRTSTLSEISAALDVPKTTCLRVLRTLESHGLLQFEEANGRYSLGYYCVILGSRAEEGLDYLAYVKPLLAEATARTSLTSAFVQRVANHRMMYVAKEEGGGAAGVSVSIRNRFPVTEVSYGKWVIAFAAPDERDELLAGGLRRLTPNTVTDVDMYRRDVDDALRDGILVSRSEYIPGITAVSCPVVDAQGHLVGVVTVLGVSEALRDEALDVVCAQMRTIAARARFDGGTDGPDDRATGSAPPTPTPSTSLEAS